MPLRLFCLDVRILINHWTVLLLNVLSKPLLCPFTVTNSLIFASV